MGLQTVRQVAICGITDIDFVITIKIFGEELELQAKNVEELSISRHNLASLHWIWEAALTVHH